MIRLPYGYITFRGRQLTDQEVDRYNQIEDQLQEMSELFDGTETTLGETGQEMDQLLLEKHSIINRPAEEA